VKLSFEGFFAFFGPSRLWVTSQYTWVNNLAIGVSCSDERDMQTERSLGACSEQVIDGELTVPIREDTSHSRVECPEGESQSACALPGELASSLMVVSAAAETEEYESDSKAISEGI
jgi:hypothetical protein